MSYSMPVNWKALLKDAQWFEFDHNGSRYRAANYKLDGGTFIAIHKFVGIDKCQAGNGWAGQAWCLTNDSVDGWPSKIEAENIINASLSNAKLEEPTATPPTEEIPNVRTTPSQDNVVDGIPLPPPGERRYN